MPDAVVLRYVDDGNHPHLRDGAFLEAYDPEARDGRGLVVWTINSEKAMVFESTAAAMAAWRSTSVTHPVRDDGKPNRPLTAFTVRVETVHYHVQFEGEQN